MKPYYKNPIFIFITATIVCCIFYINNFIIYNESDRCFLGLSLQNELEFEIFANYINAILLSLFFSKTINTKYVMILVYLSMLILNLMACFYIALAWFGITMDNSNLLSVIYFGIFNGFYDESNVNLYSFFKFFIKEHPIKLLILTLVAYVTYLMIDKLIVIPIKNYIKKKY